GAVAHGRETVVRIRGIAVVLADPGQSAVGLRGIVECTYHRHQVGAILRAPGVDLDLDGIGGSVGDQVEQHVVVGGGGVVQRLLGDDADLLVDQAVGVRLVGHRSQVVDVR